MAQTEKKRGILLTVWLGLMLIANAIVAASYLLNNTAIASSLPLVPSWIFYLLGIGALLNVVFTIFLFMWKKWAFFAFLAMAIIVFIINTIILDIGISGLLGLLGPIILYLIMRPNWKQFE